MDYLELKKSSWLDRHLDPLRAWILRRYEKEIADVDLETKERAARNEVAIFAHPVIRFLVFLSALLVFGAILRYTAPPRGILAALKGQRTVALNSAEICFGTGCLDSSSQWEKITLPYRGLKSLSQDRKRDLYYRFQIDRSPEEMREFDAAFFPIPWGDAEIYRSGALVRSGVNIQPVVPLTKPREEVVIHVIHPSGRDFGFGTMYAPFLSSAALASSIEKELAGEPFQLLYSFVAQISGLCLLTVMFLAFPYRPELFAFLVQFGIETIRTYFYEVDSEGNLVLGSAMADHLAYNLLTVAGGLAMIFFIGVFFRLPLKSIVSFLNRYLIVVVLGIAGTFVTLTTFLPNLNGDSALFISMWVITSVVSILLVRKSVIKLFADRLNVRLTLGTSAILGTVYWAATNTRDYLAIGSQITTEYNNHLHFFFFMATVLGIEIGRTEVKLKSFVSIVPKEIVALIERRESSWRKGFVILVDVVGWTDKLLKLNRDQTDIYIQKINEYLLSVFDDEPGASVVNGTGDGFFLTFEGEPTEEKLLRLVEAARKLAIARPKAGAIGIEIPAVRDELIVVRSALAYGDYKLELSKARNLKRDFIAGYLPTFLSRLIGDEKQPTGPRILSSIPDFLSSPLDSFRGERAVRSQETKGISLNYWIYD